MLGLFARAAASRLAESVIVVQNEHTVPNTSAYSLRLEGQGDPVCGDG
jgi:hypothetical protein